MRCGDCAGGKLVEQGLLVRYPTVLMDDLGLGYDPRPAERFWRNTPIPPMDSPLPAAPRLVRIAKAMWWNGPPWTILRNRNAFLAHAMDWAFEQDMEYLLITIPREHWIAMFATLRPGMVSARSYRYYRWRLGNREPLPDEWQHRSHIKDLVYEFDSFGWDRLGRID